MRVASAPISLVRALRKTENPAAPAWVEELTELGNPKLLPGPPGLKHGVHRGPEFCRVALKIDRAVELNAATLRQRTQLAYQTVLQSLSGFSPIRFWNFIPSIHDVLDENQSRYMIFNAGRYQAFENHYGNHEQFDTRVATASAVGHQGGALWIHCLAARKPAVHLGNPRQISPHKYSSRFGKRPPCFARATYLPESKLLLIGGTASICGEDSLHDNLVAQTSETIANLRELIASAHAHARAACPADPLGCIADLRAYHPRAGDADWLRTSLRERIPGIMQLSLVHSDLCRPELLVEIEGLARLSD